MNRMADIYYKDRLAGKLEEIGDSTYRFTYNKSYLIEGEPVSVTLPLQSGSFESNELFSFFAGLVPEGWYLKIVSKTVKVDKSDTFGLLIKTCGDCIGAVSVREISGIDD